MFIKMLIFDEIENIAREHKKQLAPLTDDLPLLGSGLDSLCVAVLLARLEDALGVDPFDRDVSIPLPVTIGDLIGLYRDATS